MTFQFWEETRYLNIIEWIGAHVVEQYIKG